MNDRRRNIRQRLEKQRKISGRNMNGAWRHIDNHDNGYNSYSFEESEHDHPLFKKEYFFFKLLAAIGLFLTVAVIYKNPSQQLDGVKHYVTRTMSQEIQFASISSWYESTFGKPIAFLPQQEKTKEAVDQPYALPASGKITQTYKTNGNGIIVVTSKGAKVEAINDGIVTFAGTKDGLGKTIIIQHPNKSESWYGQLKSFDVDLYEPVKKGSQIGQVTGSEDGTKGTFYLAIKKDGIFVDPKKVISFE